jgi:argininosuccinate lyase
LVWVEDIFLWATDEFSMVELDDAFAGTSSIMPQKKNPLLQETARAIAGSLRYVKVKMAPLHWLYYLKQVFRG